MCCYAGKLLQQPEMHNPTIIVVTDRNNLDGQLYETFCNAQELLKQTPVQARSRNELRNLISERETGGIIFTTVQKFALKDDEREHIVLNDRHNIVVISDEAHRSQYGLDANLKSDGSYRFGYAKHMRDAIPNASFIGFTGTPISLNERDTVAVFGDYVSIYDIQDAVDDGSTVPIYYESRLAKLNLNQKEIEELSKQVDELIADENHSEQEKTKGVWSRLEKIVGASPRLEIVSKDLVNHFETRCEVMEGKGMIVGMSRDICAYLYNEIIKLRPEWHDNDPTKGAIKVIITGASSDKPLLQPHIRSKRMKDDIAKRFKNPDDPLRLVIVCDMWLTGFDVPCCHTMYVDKPMRGHSLMQAIARVNRVFKDKPGGLVVDYIGIASELKNALKTYTDSKGRGKPTREADEAFRVLAEKIDAIRGMFAKTPQNNGFDISELEDNASKLLVPAANYILGLDDGKKRLFDLVLTVIKAYSLCSTLDEVKPLRKEIAFYSAIKAALSKVHITPIPGNNKNAKNSALKQILDNAIIADGVTDIFKLCGLDKPNIGLLSDEFLEDVRRMPEQNLAVELLERLLADAIKSKIRNNVVLEKRYGDRLQKTLRLYNNRTIETAQVIEELIQMAKDYQEELKKEESLGLNVDEIAFYDALANNESAVRELGDETLKKIATVITEKLRKSTTVDWQVRESVRSKLRILVRRTLQRYKYPPDKSAEAVDLIMEQAEALSNSWSV